ncbi:MAG: succinate dehydrogenase cytochrome b subunit [Myxococcales bacterium]|nr:succinate dehydrogenase cytochrome b subunit [Myxococcales bacterium]
MNFLLSFWRSTVGTKVVVAVTGLMLLGFTLFHMIGNLQVFTGAEDMNAYGAFLHKPEVLWAGRCVVATSMILHITGTVRLVRASADARPQGYAKWKAQASTFYSRTMKFSGPIVLIYFVVHLLNLTTGAEPGHIALHPNYLQTDGVPKAFENLTLLLATPPWATFYIVANLALGLHLFHGAYSLAKTLGLSGARQLRLARVLASVLTATIVGGNIAITLACLLRLV